MKKVLSDMYETKRKKYLDLGLIILIFLTTYLHLQLASILEPSSFDMILELTTHKLAPVMKSAIALNNYRPQLGQLTFYLTGGASRLWGIEAGYLIRYIFFFFNVFALFLLFKEFVKDKEDRVKNVFIFFLTVSLTFFSMIKYFFVVDFLTSLLFSFLSLLFIVQNRSKTLVFLSLCAAIYFKFSILIFLGPLLGIIARDNSKIKKYLPAFIASIILGLILFFSKSVDNVLGQRGLFSILKQSEFINFSFVNLFGPWEFFKTFDQSVATYATSWTPYLIVKVVLIAILAATIFLKNKFNAALDFLLVCLCFVGIVAIQPQDPWFHDIAFYLGMLGLLVMVLSWKYMDVIFNRKNLVILLALFAGDFYYWNQSIEKVNVINPKNELQSFLKNEIKSHQVTDLYLYCMNNVGEFEWNLLKEKDLKIHYILDAEDVDQNKGKNVTSKSLWLFPKKCLHEVPAANLGLFSVEGASFQRDFHLSKMEYYKVYSNY